jgi:hypothetical protein
MEGRTSRVPFVALVVGVLVAGLVGLLVLNTSLQRGAYVVTDLRAQAAELGLRQQNLQLTVAELQAPQRVAEEALALGMVSNDSPAFLSLSTGKVIGVPAAGRPGDQVSIGSTASGTESGAGKPLPVVAGTRNSGSTGVERLPSTEQAHRDTGGSGDQLRDGAEPRGSGSGADPSRGRPQQRAATGTRDVR